MQPNSYEGIQLICKTIFCFDMIKDFDKKVNVLNYSLLVSNNIISLSKIIDYK